MQAEVYRQLCQHSAAFRWLHDVWGVPLGVMVILIFPVFLVSLHWFVLEQHWLGASCGLWAVGSSGLVCPQGTQNHTMC